MWGNFSPCWVTQESVCTYYEYEYSSRWPIWHQKISQMSITVWPEAIWIKVKSWWQILMQHQSTYPRGPESASIEILPFRPHFINFSKTVSYEVNIASQCSHLEVLLWSKFWSERGISIGRDSGPLRYVLWCCCSICHQLSTFIKIDSGHTVGPPKKLKCHLWTAPFKTSICSPSCLQQSPLMNEMQ